MILASTTSSYWYLMRGSGVVSLALLSLVGLLGMATAMNWSIPKLPKFVVQGIHRSVSLCSMLFLGVHITTAILDSYVNVSIKDAFIPFVSSYQTLWLGLGTLSIDLMLVIIATSLLRDHIGTKVWRFIHWAAYACWPVAMIHSLAIGTDSSKSWMLALYAVEAVAFLSVLAARIRGRGEASAQTRFERQAMARRIS